MRMGVPTAIVGVAFFTAWGATSAEPLFAPRLSEALSQKIIEGCRNYAEENEIAVAIAVVDDRMKLSAFLRMDNVRQGAADFALEKAESAAAWHWSTGDNQDALADNNMVFIFAPHVSPLRGGLPVVASDNTVLGGVGVSGSPAPIDEECAQAGLKNAGLTSQVEE